jgi:hypothetical protein
MPADATGCSRDGEDRVKADDGVAVNASIAAPASAATIPPDKIRELI